MRHPRWSWLVAALLAAVLPVTAQVAGTRIIAPPPPVEPPVTPPALSPLERQWMAYARSGARDEAARKTLLDAGEKAVEALLDLVFGKAGGTLSAEDVEGLVKKLGDDAYEVREAASRTLMEHMPEVAALLGKHKDSDDAEVRWRIDKILATSKKPSAWMDQRTRQEVYTAATELLEVNLPPATVCAAMRGRVDRLLAVSEIGATWDAQPLAPLLASLRYSDKPEDREKLAQFAVKAQDGPASIAMVILREGLSQRTRKDMPEHWQKLPEHDFRKTAMECLDPKRPKLLRESLTLAAGQPGFGKRLKEILPQTTDAVLRSKIENLMWRYGSE